MPISWCSILSWILRSSNGRIFMDLRFCVDLLNLLIFFNRCHYWWLELMGIVGCWWNDLLFWYTSFLTVILYFPEKLLFKTCLLWYYLFFYCLHIHILFIRIFLFIWLVFDWLIRIPFFTLHKIIIDIDDFWLLITIIWIWIINLIKINMLRYSLCYSTNAESFP